MNVLHKKEQAISVARSKASHRWRWVRRCIAGVIIVYTLSIVGLFLVHRLNPQRSGALGLLHVIVPYLFVPLPAALPVALLRRAWWSAGVLVLGVAVGLSAFVLPLRWSAPAEATTGRTVEIMSWNVRLRTGTQTERVCTALGATTATIVVMVEVRPAEVRCAADVTARFPYRYSGDPASDEVLILSSYPIQALDVKDDHAALRASAVVAEVKLDANRAITVIAAHPPAPDTVVRRSGACDQITCFDPSERDATSARLRALVDSLMARGKTVVLAGDFNVTEREPGYTDLSKGLLDAQREVGVGLGNTWGYQSRLPLIVPLLRIDYQFTSPDLRPIRLRLDCTQRGSDHCILHGIFALP